MYINEESYYKPLPACPNLGLKPGDRLTFLKGVGTITGIEPDWVEVEEELPAYVLCKYFFKHWTGRVDSYRRAVNKAFIISGDVSFQVEVPDGSEDD